MVGDHIMTERDQQMGGKLALSVTPFGHLYSEI